MKIYVENDSNKRINNFSTLSCDKPKISQYSPIADIKDNGDYFDNCFEINGKVYSVCMKNLKDNYLVVKEIELSDEEETFAEDKITCPVCGYVDTDCWEYNHDYDEEYACPTCGSLLTWEREIEVTYTTKLKSKTKPIQVEVNKEC